MEGRPFSLNDRITVSDRAGPIGSGTIVGKTYQTPATYDVRLDDGQLIINVAADDDVVFVTRPQVCSDG